MKGERGSSIYVDPDFLGVLRTEGPKGYKFSPREVHRTSQHRCPRYKKTIRGVFDTAGFYTVLREHRSFPQPANEKGNENGTKGPIEMKTDENIEMLDRWQEHLRTPEGSDRLRDALLLIGVSKGVARPAGTRKSVRFGTTTTQTYSPKEPIVPVPVSKEVEQRGMYTALCNMITHKRAAAIASRKRTQAVLNYEIQ